jgi:TrmH family RNA methyltransferase
MGDLTPFRFLLVEPRYAGNVGSTARVLKNFGFHRLELAAPLCSTDDEEARRFAVDAGDVLAAAKVYDTLDAALASATSVVGLSRRMGKQRQPHYRVDEIAPRLAGMVRHDPRGEVVLLFGREADGLHDRELDQCTHLAYIPTSATYPATNLAQAVAIVAYELSRAIDALAPAPAPRPLGTADDADEIDDALADHAAREAMYAHLEESLAAIGFLKDGQVEGMMRRLRRILGRAQLTAGDVNVVRGIARQVLWLSRNR